MWLVLASLVHVTLRISLDVHGDQQSFVASSRCFCRFFRLFVTQQWKVGNVNMVLEGYSFVGLFVIVQKLFVTVRETLYIQSAFLNIKWVLFQIHHARSCNKLPWTVHHITWNIFKQKMYKIAYFEILTKKLNQEWVRAQCSNSLIRGGQKYFLKVCDLLSIRSGNYSTRAIITRSLYIFYPIFHCGL